MFKIGPKQLKKLVKDRSNKKDLIMLLVGPAYHRNKGNAVLGAACREDGYTFGMVEARNNDTETARILAHEIGHTLGMK